MFSVLLLSVLILLENHNYFLYELNSNRGVRIMDNWLFTSIFVFLGSIWFWMKHATSRSMKNHKTFAKIPSNNFHGVSIQPCSHPCNHVCNMKKVRFLSDETPRLPIDGCSNQQCTCTYIHHQDRRINKERRLTFLSDFAKNNRHNKLERRYHNLS